MRKCEEHIVDAIKNGHNYHDHNNMVHHYKGKYRVYLFGNLIATGETGEMPIRFSFCGYNTPTTRSRLRALGCMLDRVGIGKYAISGKTIKNYARAYTCKGNPARDMVIRD